VNPYEETPLHARRAELADDLRRDQLRSNGGADPRFEYDLIHFGSLLRRLTEGSRTMSMDPDGTNRIINRRITEFYAEREGDRVAHQIARHRPERHVSVPRFLAAIGLKLQSARRALPLNGRAVPSTKDHAAETHLR
jgi:hypothetical protein